MKYADGRDCPSLTANPLKLLDLVDAKFREDLGLLEAGTDPDRIRSFKTRFQGPFGKAPRAGSRRTR